MALHGVCMSLLIARYIYNIMYKTTGWRRRRLLYHIYNNCVICMKQSRGNFAAEKVNNGCKIMTRRMTASVIAMSMVMDIIAMM